MRSRKLGRDGPPLSVVTFGTWAAGGMGWGKVQDEEVVAAMRRALELGVTTFDTADAYGWGHAEELIARAFKGRREEIFIATKLGITRRGDINLSPGYFPKACEASLRRLGTDRIDLYQIHWPDDPATPIEDAWAAMCRLRDEGKVRYLGVSNFDAKQLGACEDIRHVDSVQNEYSMLVCDPEDDVLPWCREHGTGLLSYGSLAYGILTGKFDDRTRFPKSDWRSGSHGFGYYDRLFEGAAFRRNLRRVARLRDVAAGLGVTVAQLAIAWILRNEAVTSAICGAKRPAQVEENAKAADLVLDGATLASIDEALSARG